MAFSCAVVSFVIELGIHFCTYLKQLLSVEKAPKSLLPAVGQTEINI